MSDEYDRRLGEIERRFAAEPSKIPVIVGPTASGKSELALGLSERVGGEIISVDSVQIYQEFDIGSGKPNADERQRVPHQLVDVVPPMESIDAAEFARRADAAIAATRARGAVPILCGGTFLWIKAVLNGLLRAPPADPVIRAEHRFLYDGEGAEALHARLGVVDPVLASRLHPNDFVRVSRGLEMHALTGRPLSEWQTEHGFAPVRHAALLFAMATAPEVLTRRIEARIHRWLGGGWIDETEQLLVKGYRSARAMSSVGYLEVCRHIDGQIPRSDLAVAITRSTRIFARRQRTWLRSAPVTWI